MISGQRRPYICSKHFHKKDVGYRRLATGALPSLFLSAPPGFAEEESARIAELQTEHSEKVRLVNLMNDAVLEWVSRAQQYVDTVSISKTRRELRRVGNRVRNLLGATLSVAVDDYWLRKFRRSHIVLLTQERQKKSRNKTLKLETIIRDIDPNATILSEDEIGVLLEEEKARNAEIEAKRNIAKARKKAYTESLLVVGSHGKKYKAKKNASDNSFADYSGHSSDNLRDDSMSSGCYQVKSECSEVKSECNDSIDISLSDDDNMDAGNDIEQSGNKADQSTKDEVIIDSYQQALEHLKPLEDFALRQENYRAIGLLTTLEIIFKNPKKNSDA